VQGAKISDMTTKRGIFYYKIHIAYSVKMDIRRRFLDYFQERRHLIMPSSSLIPKNDPSVLLTTAGMQQFKPYYLGTEEPPETRIATVQKCFRTSDIESVGYTDRHLTFFEMLGNFSFGDYFKKEAIALAIDFCVNCLDLPREKLFTAVFSGDKDIPADEESIQYWLDNGINKDRIYRLGREENFWGPADPAPRSILIMGRVRAAAGKTAIHHANAEGFWKYGTWSLPSIILTVRAIRNFPGRI
jgi:alanyl-tRNA synthetase